MEWLARPLTLSLVRFRKRRFGYQRAVPMPWVAYPQQLFGAAFYFRFPTYPLTDTLFRVYVLLH